ncbi:hypothetical protein ABZP36_021156 [Zizania latifolia]
MGRREAASPTAIQSSSRTRREAAGKEAEGDAQAEAEGFRRVEVGEGKGKTPWEEGEEAFARRRDGGRYREKSIEDDKVRVVRNDDECMLNDATIVARMVTTSYANGCVRGVEGWVQQTITVHRDRRGNLPPPIRS